MADKILIVDDEPVQRRLLEAALVKGGHSVIVAETGEQALELFDGNQPRDEYAIDKVRYLRKIASPAN